MSLMALHAADFTHVRCVRIDIAIISFLCQVFIRRSMAMQTSAKINIFIGLGLTMTGLTVQSALDMTICKKLICGHALSNAACEQADDE